MPLTQRLALHPVHALIAALLGGCAAPAGGGFRAAPEPVTPRYINPGTMAALPGFTHAVKVGSTVYVSGQVALDSAGQLVGRGDLRAQARQAFANLAQVLRIAGAAPADLTKLTIYMVGPSQRDFDVVREVAAEVLPARNPPAGVVLGVQSLPMDGLLIAVEATAVVRAMFRPVVDERERPR